jgi:large subunit ribosomal protein L35
MKTHKTISKRVKVTASGKLIKRKAGQDHFNSRESGNVTRSKRRDQSINASYVRSIKSLI